MLRTLGKLRLRPLGLVLKLYFNHRRLALGLRIYPDVGAAELSIGPIFLKAIWWRRIAYLPDPGGRCWGLFAVVFRTPHFTGYAATIGAFNVSKYVFHKPRAVSRDRNE